MPRGPSRAAAVRRLVPGARQRHRRATSWGLPGRNSRDRAPISAARAVTKPRLVRRRRAGRSRPAQQAAAQALETALAALGPRYGADWRAWRWGDAHPAVLAHRPFEQRAAPARLVQPPCPGRRRRQHGQRGEPRPGATRTLPFAAVHARGLPGDLRPRRPGSRRAGSRPPASPATRSRRTTSTWRDCGAKVATCR